MIIPPVGRMLLDGEPMSNLEHAFDNIYNEIEYRRERYSLSHNYQVIANQTYYSDIVLREFSFTFPEIQRKMWISSANRRAEEALNTEEYRRNYSYFKNWVLEELYVSRILLIYFIFCQKIYLGLCCFNLNLPCTQKVRCWLLVSYF